MMTLRQVEQACKVSTDPALRDGQVSSEEFKQAGLVGVEAP